MFLFNIFVCKVGYCVVGVWVYNVDVVFVFKDKW